MGPCRKPLPHPGCQVGQRDTSPVWGLSLMLTPKLHWLGEHMPSAEKRISGGWPGQEMWVRSGKSLFNYLPWTKLECAVIYNLKKKKKTPKFLI